MQFKELNKSLEGARVVFGLLSDRRSMTSGKSSDDRAKKRIGGSFVTLFVSFISSLQSNDASLRSIWLLKSRAMLTRYSRKYRLIDFNTNSRLKDFLY